MALMLDNQAPQIVNTPRQVGQNLEFEVNENGSGVDFTKSAFIFRGKRNLLKTDSKGHLHVRINEVGHEFGEADGQLELYDLAGNKSLSKNINIALQGTPQAQIYVYPNPARQILNYEIRTNFIPISAEMYVYDSVGDRVYSESLEMNTMREKYQWPLINVFGDMVSRGVYFLRIKLVEQTRTLKKTMKVVVLN